MPTVIWYRVCAMCSSGCRARAGGGVRVRAAEGEVGGGGAATLLVRACARKVL
jgi:hypothetical protein